MRPGSAFLGYPRADGRVGVRNHVLVVPTVICAAVVAERIAAAIAPIGAALPHLAGCGQLGPDLNVTHDTLAAYTRHPNVGAVIVVALGCEQVVAQYLADSARQAGKPAQIVSIQGEGGTVRATARGIEIARELAEVVGRAERAWCPASALVLSVKCGGSDYTSGLASNPVVGRVADRLVDLGGAVVLGEIAEIMGAEHLLAARASSPAAADRLLRVVSRVEAEAMALGLDIRGTQPSPGNIRGGLTTIEEKSLGATHKAGERTQLNDVVAYSAPITKPGLTVMDTPGLDVESVTGMVGGGAQIVVFTTGLGTPTGNPIAPVVKITGNARTAQTMADNTDLDVSGVITDAESFEQAAERLFQEIIEVSSGRPTAAERLGHREFAIHRRNPTI
jgi:altronate dehydratase large subunit